MNKTLIASLLGLTLSSPGYSAENIALDDVVVTATRTAQARKNIIADVTVIGREEIERAGSASVADILRRQPGVQVGTNGGAGAISSIFLRGTNSDHVVVLVDGLRINSLTAGTTAFENIPIAQIEKIEILRGPASSLYAAGAIGGVIQIFTKRDTSQKPRVHAAAGLGSYDTKKAEASIHGKYKDLQYGFNVSSLDTSGFSAIRKRGGTFDKDNDAYNNLSTSGFLELELKPGHTFGLQFFKNQGRSNTDSGSDNFDNYSRQTLQSYAFTSKNQFADFWRSTLTLGKGVDRMTSYALPSAWTRPDGASRFRSDQQQLTWQNDFTLPLGTLTLAYDHLKQKVISTTDYANTQRNNDGFLVSYLLNHDKHTVQASLREDHNSQYGNYTTGGLGYGYHFTPAWYASANYGNAFKAPSFNELYWPGFATPRLTPEKSDNVDVAIQYTGARFNGGITAFQNKIRGLIANSGPASDTCAWGNCPFNIDKVDIQGITFDGSWDITDSLLLSGNYTVQSPRDEETDQLLVRRGNRYGAINLLHSIGDLQWGIEISGASARYNDAANTVKMRGYMLVNLTANYKLSPEWKLEARANNILDKDYALALAWSGDAYNTAGSNLFVGLRYDMKP